MKVYTENPVARCPHCNRTMKIVSEPKPEHTHLIVACFCDGILWAMPRPFLILEPVRQ